MGLDKYFQCEFKSSGIRRLGDWYLLVGMSHAIKTATTTTNHAFAIQFTHYDNSNLLIWVYWDQLDANCLVLFYYTFCSTCFGCNIHPSSGASYNAHAV